MPLTVEDLLGKRFGIPSEGPATLPWLVLTVDGKIVTLARGDQRCKLPLSLLIDNIRYGLLEEV